MAIECSKPSVTNPAMGSTMARILSVTVWQANDSQTARQTSRLHSTPRKNACLNDSAALASAILTAVSREPPISSTPLQCTSSASSTAPATLATNDTPQLRASARVETLASAQAMTISVLPVNSSAPPMMIRMSPRLNDNPPTRRFGPKPSVPPVITIV